MKLLLVDSDEYSFGAASSTTSQQNIQSFNELCDSIFVNNTAIKNIRIISNDARNEGGWGGFGRSRGLSMAGTTDPPPTRMMGDHTG